jgi:hypothetical protein
MPWCKQADSSGHGSGETAGGGPTPTTAPGPAVGHGGSRWVTVGHGGSLWVTADERGSGGLSDGEGVAWPHRHTTRQRVAMARHGISLSR